MPIPYTNPTFAAVQSILKIKYPDGALPQALYKDFPPCQAAVLNSSSVSYYPDLRTRGMKVRCDREQTAHLQTALLHLPVRTQIRTAQSGSIRSTGLGAIAATQG
jgi:hypothetical protein